MRCMVANATGAPLVLQTRPDPAPARGEVRIRVQACGVCRTDLHVIVGDLGPIRRSVVPGHEVVGVVDAVGPGVRGRQPGQTVGIAWLASACGHCRYCRARRENLCDSALFHGWSRDGGFADVMIAQEAACLTLPEGYAAAAAAPLLCAGLIGYRAWRKTGPPRQVRRLGLYGFGAAAHILTQVARAHGQEVFAFTRPGDRIAQEFARRCGCAWAGSSREPAPEPLDAAIIFAPVGELVPTALAAVRKGGTVVCGGIHMSDIPGFAYRMVWEERTLTSVANLTRADGRAFMALAADLPIQTTTTLYALEDANDALADLRQGRLAGAAVLVMS